MTMFLGNITRPSFACSITPLAEHSSLHIAKEIKPTNKVRPRKTRDGYNLEGERLSHGSLWYGDAESAIDYAKWLSRVKGCQIEIADINANIIRVEKVPAGVFAY